MQDSAPCGDQHLPISRMKKGLRCLEKPVHFQQHRAVQLRSGYRSCRLKRVSRRDASESDELPDLSAPSQPPCDGFNRPPCDGFNRDHCSSTEIAQPTCHRLIIDTLHVERDNMLEPSIVEPSFPPGYLQEYNGNTVIAYSIVFFILQCLFLGLRFWSRHLAKVPWGWDDSFMVASAVVLTAIIATSLCIPPVYPEISCY